MSSQGILDEAVDVLYGGVDFKLPGNGGADCVAFMSLKRRTLETLGYVLFNCILFIVAKRKCKLPSHIPRCSQRGSSITKMTLLGLLCLIFGIELGYKFSTKQAIYLLNPCHILTITQVSKTLTLT